MKISALLSLLLPCGAVAVLAGPHEADDALAKRATNFPRITVRGNTFMADDKRFYIRGIGYQPGGSSANMDPLADPKICLRDIKMFTELGINAIRVYTVDNSKNHTECMDALKNAGIYLILDVNNPGFSLNREKPKRSYNTRYLQNVFATVDKFARYDNTLAFFSGNEVMNEDPSTIKAAPYVKAVTRDIKNYLNSRGLRPVPVGYSAVDVLGNLLQVAAYMNCGSDDARPDFFAFNDYSWCNSDFVTSRWAQKVKDFSDYGLPIFLSEWGCNQYRPRKFTELSAMMSAKMTPVYSGGVMYEYSQEANEYGIVQLDSGRAKPLEEFGLYRSALKAYPAPSGDGGSTQTTTHAVACPTKDSAWDVEPSLVPKMPQQAEKYMKNGAGRGPGLKAWGSQEAADSGTATASVSNGLPSPTASRVADNKPQTKAEEEDGASGLERPLKTMAAVTGLAVLLSLLGALVL